MNVVTLPAINGRSALGFLSALGVLRLLEEEVDDPGINNPRLAWDPMTGQARVLVEGGLDDIIDALLGVAQGIIDGARLPHGPPAFPGDEAPDENWPRGDPMRMPVEAFADEIARLRGHYSENFVDRWLPAMVTDQAADEKSCVALTSFAAPSGQQKFSTMFAKPLELVVNETELLREALVSWRRHDGVTGEYLDHRVLRSAADTTQGKSIEAGVPGATWLALMALPWLPVRGVGGDPLSTGWQPRRRRPVLVWPLWEDALPSLAVKSLISHPGLSIKERGKSVVSVGMSSLRPLSVFNVYGAERQMIAGRNFAGVLSPVRLELGSSSPVPT